MGGNFLRLLGVRRGGRFANYDERLDHLYSVPANNAQNLLDHPKLHEALLVRLAQVGLPVANVRGLGGLRPYPTSPDGGEIRAGGVDGLTHPLSWPSRPRSREVLLLFPLDFLQLAPERQLNAMAEELAHTNTPFVTSNSDLFGSRQARIRAAREATTLAQVCRRTGVYLNDYHAALAAQREAHLVDDYVFNDETWAIWARMGLCDREGLATVESHLKLAIQDDAIEYDAPTLVSARGIDQAQGIDVHLGALMGDIPLRIILAHTQDLQEDFRASFNAEDSR